MSFTEKILEEYRAARRAERNRALKARLSVPRTTEELFAAMRALGGRAPHERENRAKYAENV